MKLLNLSESATAQCYLLHFNGVCIMLDCGVDAVSLVAGSVGAGEVDGADGEGDPTKVRTLLGDSRDIRLQTPRLDAVDLAHVDAILVSNQATLLALPYVTELSSFRGVVYATEPTIRFGEMYMEELCNYAHPATAAEGITSDTTTTTTTTDAGDKHQTISGRPAKKPKLAPSPHPSSAPAASTASTKNTKKIKDVTTTTTPTNHSGPAVETNPPSGRVPYRRGDIKACVANINPVSFRQKVHTQTRAQTRAHTHAYS